MTTEEILASGASAGVLLFVVVLAILLLLMPFFIYGTNKRTKETSLKLSETNRILEEIREQLRRSG